MRIRHLILAFTALCFSAPAAWSYEMASGASNAIATLILIAENSTDSQESRRMANLKLREELKKYQKLVKKSYDSLSTDAQEAIRKNRIIQSSPKVRKELRAHQQRLQAAFTSLSYEAQRAVRINRTQQDHGRE